MFRVTGIAALSAALASTALAQDAPRIAAYVPPAPDRAHLFVLDSAHILSAATIAALNDSSRALQTETSADVVWLTLPTLGGRPIEEAALYVGRTWRIGSPGKPGDPLRNRGLVVLYVPDRTKTAGPNFRVEVGNGLEGTITDARSRSISASMREDLRAKRYDAAYLAGWTMAARLVRDDFAAARAVGLRAATPVAPARVRAANARVFIVLAIVAAVVVILIVLIVFAARHRPRRGAARRDDSDAGKPRRRRRASAAAAAASSSYTSSDSGSSNSDSSSSSDNFGGGGGFSGGGSSDTI